VKYIKIPREVDKKRKARDFSLLAKVISLVSPSQLLFRLLLFNLTKVYLDFFVFISETLWLSFTDSYREVMINFSKTWCCASFSQDFSIGQNGTRNLLHGRPNLEFFTPT